MYAIRSYYDTYRILGHSGCRKQDAAGYRQSCEIDEWEARCPVILEQRALLDACVLDPAELAAREESIRAELDEAFAFALASPRITSYNVCYTKLLRFSSR